MPYITQERRDALTKTLTPLPDTPKNAGELNYAITLLLIQYWKDGGRYQHINDILGACEGAKLEFYRRIAAPYEATKIAENGDVYP